MKNNDPCGVESLVIWNAGLILSFILIISLGSVGPLFNHILSSLSEVFPAKLH